jgi:aryl-alcohol dehydrogenase-like predicted oxidoreductase
MGLGSSFGIGAAGIEAAYHEYGLNYLYWGSIRRPGFGKGIRHLARHHRDDLVVVLQTYSRSASLMKASIHIGLKRLGLDYADIMLYGMFNRPPARRLIDAGLALRERGLVRHLAVSCHNRPLFQRYRAEGLFDVFHLRYNAAHRGAESEIFPYLGEPALRPGTVAFTALRWGSLIKPAAAPPGEPVPTPADCYRFVLAHPDVDVVIAGPKNMTHLHQAAEALDRGPMSEEELAWMQRVGDHVYKKALRGR